MPKDPIIFSKYNSPVAQLHEWSPLDAYGWQKAGWDACWKMGAKVAIRTANGSGKSSLFVPVLALSFAAAFPGATVVITSSSEAQISQQLWPAIQQMALGHAGWKVNKDVIELPGQEGVLGSKIILRVTKQADKFEGYHERSGLEDNAGRIRYGPLLIIADEAKSIDDKIFEAIGRCTPDVELRISTCGEDSGGFYEACANTDGTWVTAGSYDGIDYDFVIDWEQCPHLQEGWRGDNARAEIKTKGRDDPYIRSRYLAQFTRGSEFQVFTEAEMSLASDAMQKMVPLVGTAQRAFCDFSGGGDELTFGHRRGNDIDPIVAWTRDKEVAPSVEAEKYLGLFKGKGLVSSQVSGDNGGLGAGIITEMHDRNFKIRRINANIPPKQRDQFVDRYTEKHWEFKAALHGGMLRLPYDKKLLEQMRHRRYLMKNSDDNKIKMEPKREARLKRKVKSPDRLDTIIELVSDMEALPTAGDVINPHRRCPTPKEYMAQIKKREEAVIEDKGGFMGGWGGR